MISDMNLVLIVDDDTALVSYLKDLLTDNNFRVKTTGDGVEALNFISETKPDLVILDLGLPTMKGESVCQEMKKKYADMPIIILTGRKETSDVVNLLSIGADDYISKPFAAEELLARIQVQLKKLGKTDSILQVDDLALDQKRFYVKRKGKEINLTPKEFKLLEYLMLNKNQVLTREMILNRIWLFTTDIETRVVDVYVNILRKKIDKGFKKKLIHSVRGFGYMIKE